MFLVRLHSVFSLETGFYLCLYPSIHQSIHQSIYQSIHLFINQSIHSSVHPSVHPSIHFSIHQSIHSSSQPSVHLSVHPPTCLALSQIFKGGYVVILSQAVCLSFHPNLSIHHLDLYKFKYDLELFSCRISIVDLSFFWIWNCPLLLGGILERK